LKIEVPGYEMLGANFTFLCNNCLDNNSSRLLASWKRNNSYQYLCGKCVYDKLNQQEKAIYALGSEVGSYFEEVDWKTESMNKSEYVAVVMSDTMGKIDYFSTKQSQ
jgi:hypothetical protein